MGLNPPNDHTKFAISAKWLTLFSEKPLFSSVALDAEIMMNFAGRQPLTAFWGPAGGLWHGIRTTVCVGRANVPAALETKSAP